VIYIPTKCGLKDSKGYFCRWGKSGKKYYYNPKDPSSRERARKKADKQGQAAHASGYQGSKEHIVCYSGGVQSTAMLLHMIEKKYPIDRIIFADTGVEKPGTIEYIKKIEKHIKKEIEIIPPADSFDNWFHTKKIKGDKKGEIRGFPYPGQAMCAWKRIAKVNPIQKACSKQIAYIGYGSEEKNRIIKDKTIDYEIKYPLIEWGWTREDSEKYLLKKNLMNPLYEKFNTTSCWICPNLTKNDAFQLFLYYPKLWSRLKELEKESPHGWRPSFEISNWEKEFIELDKKGVKRIKHISRNTEDKAEPKLEPGYYSVSKPYYRYEIESIEDELKSSKWNSEKLLLDIKCDGLRLSIGKADGKPFCYVDPDTLKEKSPDVSDRLPLIIEELDSLPDGTILDAEFIAVKDNEVLHRTTANSLLNATNFSPDNLSKVAYVFVFDILYFKGENIQKQPLHERLEYLGQIESTDHILIERYTKDLDIDADAYIIDGSDTKKINTCIEKLLDAPRRPSFIAEGIMVKLLDHHYETPQNKGWGKLKKYYEVDTKIYDKKLIKGQDDVWNYFLGIEVENEHYEKLPKKVQIENSTLFNYGKTDNTKIEANEGDILRVASEEVNKYDNEGYPYYRGYINRALEIIPEKDSSDSLEVLEKLSSFQPKRMTVEEISRLGDDIPSPSGSIEFPSSSDPGQEVIQSYSIPKNKEDLKSGDYVKYDGKLYRIIDIL